MPDLHPLVERILEKRGITDRDTFLNPEYHTRHDPFLMKDMDVAVARILAAMQKGEKVAVWHDYDCDGVPGGSLLFDFFRSIKHPVSTYVPERNEGYGLNEDGIRSLKENGASLIITVDCGITDVEEVAFANGIGIDVIITDHHLPQAELPAALAVVNPHRVDDEYPFKGLCGTGVAFKLVEGFIAKGKENRKVDFPEGQEKWLLDLVALATIADMVPLTGENRALVHYGLKVLRKGRRPGLRALFEREKIPLQFVTEDDLAFSVAPKINAASRMESPKLAFELLTTLSSERARELAAKLEGLNKARKLEGMRVAKDVKKKIEGMPVLSPVIVVGSRDWRPSLLGIAATSVVETYGKTVFLWGEDKGLIKGSCRSDGNVNMVALMSAVKDSFLDFGGHEMAGGFSLSPDGIHVLSEKLEEAMERLFPPGAPREVLAIVEDSLTLSEVTDAAFDALRLLAPFGQENPKPLFRFENVQVSAVTFFGAGKDHARLSLMDEQAHADAVSFFFGRSSFKDTLGFLSPGDRITLTASIERSHFRGKKELRLRIVDIAMA